LIYIGNVVGSQHKVRSPMSRSIANIIRQRRSVRRFSAEPVSDELVMSLLELAAWAPSAHNRQPWRFAVIKEIATREKFSRKMAEQLRLSLKADGVSDNDINLDVERSRNRINGAPVVVVVCLSLRDMDSYPDKHRQFAEYQMAIQSVAMAGQTLMLAAHAADLASCWICAPLFCPDVVKNTLSLPPDWEPQGAILLGHPAEERTRSRELIASRVVLR
jgi:F420 biosynthesis protein FbiB-like protein